MSVSRNRGSRAWEEHKSWHKTFILVESCLEHERITEQKVLVLEKISAVVAIGCDEQRDVTSWVRLFSVNRFRLRLHYLLLCRHYSTLDCQLRCVSTVLRCPESHTYSHFPGTIRQWKNFNDKLSLFNTIPNCDRQTDSQTHFDRKYHTFIAYRGQKSRSTSYFLLSLWAPHPGCVRDIGLT